MARRGLLVLIAGLLLAADEPGGRDRADRDRLQGTWLLESSESGGVGVPPAKCRGITLVIKGDEFTEDEGGGVPPSRGTFAVKAADAPRAIDFTFRPDGIRAPGIYKLDGDRLTLCFGDERPRSFDTTPGSGTTACTYRRGPARAASASK